MSIFNKILNILMLLLAITAVVFGVMLFQKREELRNRGDYMADIIHKVSKTLDDTSGTEINKKLDPTVSVVANPKASGYSLYHDNYAQLATVLKTFEQQAKAIVQQKDTLGDTLHSVMVGLEIPNPDSFAAVEFQTIDKYAAKDEELLKVVQQVTERDNTIIAKIGEAASAMGFSVDGEGIKSLEDYATPLGDFVSKSQALKTRCDTYAEHIQEVYGVWELTAPSLDGSDYADALSSAKGEMDSKKADYDQTKKDLAAARATIEKLNQKITDQMEKIAALNKKIDGLKKKLAEFIMKQGNKTINFVDLLEGKVLEVDKKWGFVVINLGKHNKVMVPGKKQNQKKVEKDVALPEDRRMDVARGDNYICQIKIVDVNDNCAIGDIVPGTMKGDAVMPGDKVFFARTPKFKEEKEGAGEGAAAASEEEAATPEAAETEPAAGDDAGGDDAATDDLGGDDELGGF